jgi:PAS domain S-box-containing protein
MLALKNFFEYNIMIYIFIFSALVQTVLITVFLKIKVTKEEILSLLFFLRIKKKPLIEKEEQNKELLKDALNEHVKGVVITNEDKVVVYVNEPFLTIIGYRHRDVVGRKLTFLRGSLTTPESIVYMREKLAEKVSFDVDIVNYRKNGEAYICHIVMIPVFSKEKLTHFIAYEEDIKTIAAATLEDKDLKLFEKITAHFNAEEPFKNPHLQIANVADSLGVPARRISEALRKCEDQSFVEFVNACRIQTALKMLRNPENQHLTIESIGQTCGFNSKSAFNAAFKKETGKTPSIFRGNNTEGGHFNGFFVSILGFSTFHYIL